MALIPGLHLPDNVAIAVSRHDGIDSQVVKGESEADVAHHRLDDQVVRESSLLFTMLISWCYVHE